jgi:GR25 family glycosyltransferase involved in LPS biosynthesis
MTPYTSYAIVLQSSSQQIHYTVSKSMSLQLVESAEQYGWPLAIWPAVDGTVLPNNYWLNSSIPISTTAGKFLDKKGAWGCLLSHVSLWQHCVNVNTPIIVMEHDAVICDVWPHNLDITSSMVKLHTATKTKHKSTVGKWSTGAWAYTLTPLQALDLLEGYQRVGAMAVDKLIGTNLVSWRFLDRDLVAHNPEPHASTVSRRY